MAKLFESKNPIISESALQKTISSNTLDDIHGDVMTISGAVNKSFILFALMLLTSAFAFLNPSMPLVIGGAIGGLVVVIICSFKPHLSPILAPIYALIEGLFVGAISAVYAMEFDGIIGQAVMLTFGTLISMLLIHRSGLIPITQKFRMGVFMATGAIMLTYVASWIMSMFGLNMPYIHDAGPIGIGISVVIIGVAALNLLLDFDNFEKGEEAGAPAYMEWYFAMGLLITLVWLYIEFLRLLSKLNRD